MNDLVKIMTKTVNDFIEILKEKRMCPTMGVNCVKTDCAWWCNGACAVVRLAEGKQ